MFWSSDMQKSTLTGAFLAITIGLSPITAFSAHATDPTDQNHVVLINAFEIPEAEVPMAIEAWKKARDFLKEQPGYIETKLHRAITPNARFQLINIAKWATPEAFKAAIGNFQKTSAAAAFKGKTYHPALYVPLELGNGS